MTRRVVSIPGLFAVEAALTITLPLTYPVAAIADWSSGGRRPRRRILLFVHQALMIECLGVVATGWEWVRAGFGLRLHGPDSINRHHRLQQWWVTQLLDRAQRHLGLRVEVASRPEPTDTIIVLPRHACFADALLPSIVYRDHQTRRLRYVLKDGLLWGPCLDIVGNRLPNVFVNRSRNNRSQRVAIGELAAGAESDGGVVVFPEGTFFTEARARRAHDRLRVDDPERADRVRSLRHVLPARPGGTLAALDGAPDADVHVVAHIGFEGLASLGDLYRAVPLADPVQVEVWNIPRSEVPISGPDRVRWLDEWWRRLDEWVDARIHDREG